MQLELLKGTGSPNGLVLYDYLLELGLELVEAERATLDRLRTDGRIAFEPDGFELLELLVRLRSQSARGSHLLALLDAFGVPHEGDPAFVDLAWKRIVAHVSEHFGPAIGVKMQARTMLRSSYIGAALHRAIEEHGWRDVDEAIRLVTETNDERAVFLRERQYNVRTVLRHVPEYSERYRSWIESNAPVPVDQLIRSQQHLRDAQRAAANSSGRVRGSHPQPEPPPLDETDEAVQALLARQNQRQGGGAK